MALWPTFAPREKTPAWIQTVPDQVVTANGTLVAPFTTRGGDFLLLGLVAQATSTSFKSRINAVWEGNYLDTGPIRSTLLWGSAGTPTWVRPKFIPANSTISFELTDFSGAPNTIRLQLLGCTVPQQLREKWARRYGKGRGFMAYTLDSSDTGAIVPASGELYTAFTVEDAYNFRCDVANSVQTSTNFLANIQYRDPRMNNVVWLSNDKIHHDNVFGAQSAPGTFLVAPVMKRSSSVTFDLLDKSGAQNTIRPVLIGERVGDDPAVWDEE